MNTILKSSKTSFIRTLLGTSFIASMSQHAYAMLVNSKVIAEDVQAAIEKGGSHAATQLQNVIETSQITIKPLMLSTDTCFAALGLASACTGGYFIVNGINQLIKTHGRDEDAFKRGKAKIVVGLGIFAVGIGAIYIFGI